jgi:hypothetical protein
MGTTPTGNPRAGLREAPANTNSGIRNGNTEPMRSGDRNIGTQRDGNRTITAPRSGLPENRGTIQTAPAGDRAQPVQPAQPQRGRFFNSNENSTIESRPQQTMPSQQMEQQRYEAPRQQQQPQQQQRYEAPRQQQQPQQRYEQPRYEQRSAPTRSYDNGNRGSFGGSRSGGGFSGGSGGGGSRSSGGRR